MERLRVLLSAYACEPGKGSEPEVGWQWAMQMARFHEVTVLTRANNEPSIAAALRTTPPESSPRFVYFDLGAPILKLKKALHLHEAYHALWQRSARHVIARLLDAERFDILHHITFAGVRYPTAVLRHGTTSIFGPVGGLESTPWSLLPWRYPSELIRELARNAANRWQMLGPTLKRKASAASLTIASTAETHRELGRLGVEAKLMPTIGIHCRDFPLAENITARPDGPLRLLFAGRILYWKGVELALCALARTISTATLTFIGNGRFLRAAQRLSGDLGLEKRVEFRGQVAREKMIRSYAEFDAFLYPSLHDSGGFTLIEAMASGLPAICLDCGGPGLAVTAQCGIKVPLLSRSSTIQRLADAIHVYSLLPDLRLEHGSASRKRIEAEYDWDRKGSAMNEIYLELTRQRGKAAQSLPEPG